MDKIIYKLIIAIVAVASLVVAQREFFPKKEIIEVVKPDSTIIVENIKLKQDVDSLKAALEVKPKRVIIKVPVVKFRTDSNTIKEMQTEVDSLISLLNTVPDTVIKKEVIEKIEIQTLSYLETLRGLIDNNNVIYSETYVLGKKDNQTIVKLRPKQIKKGDELYFTNGENMNQPFGYVVYGMEIPRKIKFETSSVHVLGVSNDIDFVERFNKIVKSKNRL